MNFKKFAFAFLISLVTIATLCQEKSTSDSEKPVSRKTDRKFFISTPWLTLTNWIGEDISMYEFHAGYRITSRDIVALKFATWKILEPMGIPWGPDKMQGSEYYPGRVKEIGVGICYQRMLWKGLFASTEIMPMKKIFLDEDGNKLDEGFRLYTSWHLGYHVPLFRNRLFLEPQVHCNYWPVNSGGPQGFRDKEDKWNNYFLFEPNLYIGINF